jgi:hypothetical protein
VRKKVRMEEKGRKIVMGKQWIEAQGKERK